MKTILLTSLSLLLLFSTSISARYERNKAMPVEKVVFGTIVSIRNIKQEELVEDKNKGWRTFGAALIGGVIGNQFGGGRGRDVSTVLGAIIGSSAVHNNNSSNKKVTVHLVELMIEVDCLEQRCSQFMIIQDYDQHMVFHNQDAVRMVYLANGTVRIDKQH